MKTQIFLQARMGSTRLPRKVLMKIRGKTIIELMVERLRRIKGVDKIVLLTGLWERNEELVQEAEKLGIEYFCGSEENVLDRFYQAAKKFEPDVIIRVTGDCPLIDSELIQEGLEVFKQGDYDVVGIGRVRTYPDGLDFEVVSSEALKTAWEDSGKLYKTKQEFLDAHIPPTKYLMEKKKFRNKDIVSDRDYSNIRLTIDYQEDFTLIEKIYEALYKGDSYLRFGEILTFLAKHPELLEINRKYTKLDYGVRPEK